MNLYFLPPPIYAGKIIKAVWDRRINSTDLSTLNPDYQIFYIVENASNKDSYLDIIKVQNQIDNDGDPKYSIIDNAGTFELHEKVGWEPFKEKDELL